jgi:curved DNA-binding protein
MMKQDPYKVLGVDRSATDDDIKKAFRRLAKQHHPDRNNNSKYAESRFKEISEAYEILIDREKRRSFDTYGHDFNSYGFSRENPFHPQGPSGYNFNFRNYGNTGFGMFDDVFSDFFRTEGRRNSRRSVPRKGDNLEYDLSIEFEQAYFGVSADVRVLERRITVRIPPGVDTGSVVRVPGQGAPGSRGGEAGDLFINIAVAQHRLFRRDGVDIHLEVPISIKEAILGARVEVPSPEGRLLLKVPAGTQSGAKFRFRGKGFPSLKEDRRGDFFVTTRIVIPDTVDTLSKDLISEFDRLNPVRLREGL